MKIYVIPVLLSGLGINLISCTPVKKVETVPGIVSASGPQIAGHSDGLVHLFTCTSDGRLRENISNKPGVWSNWTDLVTTASSRLSPVIVRLEEQQELYLFFLSNDNNLCVIKKNGVGNWSSQQVLTSISASSANFSATVTDNGNIYHLLYEEN